MAKKIVLFYFLAFLALAGVFFSFYLAKSRFKKPNDFSQKAEIKGHVLYLEVADTPLLQTKGLSGRTDLPDNYGMLFIWPEADKRVFWMKDMLLPIDIIWIKGDKILGIDSNVKPEPGASIVELKKYHSPGLVDKVIEVRAGLSQEKGWRLGDQVYLSHK